MSSIPTILRPLVRRPGPSALIIVTLAGAIGAATVTASLLDMFRHFIPRQNDPQLVFVAETDPRPSLSQFGVYDGVARTGLSVPDLVDFTRRSRTIQTFAAFTNGTATLSGLGPPERISLVRATTTLLPAWEIALNVGHGFSDDDGRPGAPGVALLTNRFWREHFGASPSALGRTLRLDGNAYTIAGVLPSSLDVGILAGADVMVPLVLDAPGTPRDQRRAFTYAVLASGATRAQAAADLARIARQLAVEYPSTNARTGVVVRPPIENLGANLPMLMLLLALVALTLLAIACANVSNVMLAVGAVRQREYAVRAALGAGRWQQLVQALAESLALSLTACLFGVLLAWAGLNGLRQLDPGAASSFNGLVVNWRVLAVALLLAIVAPLGFAWLPAWRTSSVSSADLAMVARGVRMTAGGQRLRQALVAVQVGLTVILLVQIGAFARAAWMFRTLENGFTESGLLTFRLDLPLDRYGDAAAVSRFVAALLPRLAAAPGVASTAAINRMPIADREQSATLAIQGATQRPEDDPPITLAAISDSYLRTMQIPVVRGRGLDAADMTSGRRVALISDAAARRYWPGANPIGEHIAIDRNRDALDGLEIVGIVGNVRNSDVDRGPGAQVYVPLSLRPANALSFVARTTSRDPAAVTGAIRAVVAGLDATVPVYGVRTMRDVLFQDMAGTFLTVTVLLAIAGIALLLATAGIYGLTAYSVTQRTREIGVRVAIGATPAAVQRMMVLQGGRPVAIGMACGAVAAVTLAPLASAALAEVNFQDPANYGAVLAVLVLTAVSAIWLPARRATNIAPVTVLRAE